jgi:hypothetical protein
MSSLAIVTDDVYRACRLVAGRLQGRGLELRGIRT